MAKQLTQLVAFLAALASLAALSACPPSQGQVKIDPDASEKRFLLGADYFNKGLTGPALEELLKAVELNPQNPDAHNLLGLLFLRKAAESEELSTRNQCLKGEALKLEREETDRQFSKADEEFKKALENRANFSEAFNNRSVVALHFGRTQEAIDFAEKALTNIVYHDPWAAQGNLGQAYLAKRDLVRAAKALRQALFEQPKFCVGRFRLAKVYYEQKEFDKAAEEVKQVVEDKACPIQEAFHLAGLVALRQQDRTRAEELFSKCVALAPKSCVAQECRQ